MFKDIQINNFRGIKRAVFNDFKRVNLVFGSNNTGKSTLLEALFMLSGQSNPGILVYLNRSRDYNRYNLKDLKVFFHNSNVDQKIRIQSKEDSNRKLEVSCFESKSSKIDLKEVSETVSNRPEFNYGLKLDFWLDNKKFNSEVIFWEKEDGKDAKINIDPRYKESLMCKYLPSKYPYEESIGNVAEIFENKDEALILEALRIIEPNIVDIQPLNGDIYVDIGLPQRIPVNMMGDGIRKLLAVVTSLYECRNGVLLIDEIDNGIHFSFMEKMWKVILKSAQMNNTQLFATTHNIDSLRGLQKALKKSEQEIQENSAGFKLLRLPDDKVEALVYDYEKLGFAIEQEIEIR